MTSLELYWFPMSAYARSNIIFLKLNKIDYTERLVNLGKNEQHSEEFLKLNPMHRIPVLKEGDFILTESVAILQYLATKPGVPDHWYPADPRKRARVNEVIMWLTTGSITLDKIFHQIVVQHHVLKKPIDEDDLRARAGRLHEALDFIENHFLDKHDFLAGSDVTIADIFCACLLAQEEAAGLQLARNRPRLEAWYARVKDLTDGLFDALHKPVFGFTSTFWNKTF